MKKLILPLLISLISVSVNALTLDDCLIKTDIKIAKSLLLSIGYGSQNGHGNYSCLAKATTDLDVMTSNLEYEGIENTIIEDNANLEVLNTFRDPEDDGMITAIYQVTDSKLNA